MWDWGSLESVWQAIRTLRKDPGFTLVALTALTIGIGAALRAGHETVTKLRSKRTTRSKFYKRTLLIRTCTPESCQSSQLDEPVATADRAV
jgi:hypothetical protein